MRMMVVFEKGETLRYIGHLDLMRAMQRALRDLGYYQGQADGVFGEGTCHVLQVRPVGGACLA